MKNLVIVGAGGFGREVLDYATDIMQTTHEFQIKGFIDNHLHALDHYQYDYRILDSVDNYHICEDDVFICSLGDVHERKKFCTQLMDRGATFINLIHSSARIGRTSTIGIGNIMALGATLTQDVRIGNFNIINSGSGCGHDVRMGDFCTISSACDITGFAQLEDGVFLGSHAVICPHVKVGQYARVGAGSIVLKNVKEKTTVFGNPAREIF